MVYPNEPSPWYEFEMLKKDASGSGGSPTLFLHYKVAVCSFIGYSGLRTGVALTRCWLKYAIDGMGEPSSSHGSVEDLRVYNRQHGRRKNASPLVLITA